jgi:hypothetical protein
MYNYFENPFYTDFTGNKYYHYKNFEQEDLYQYIEKNSI